MMKIAVVFGLVACFLAVEGFGGLDLLFEETEKAEGRVELNTEDRFKDNELLEKAERDSGKFASSNGFGDKLKFSESTGHEYIYNSEDFDDLAKKNALDSSSSFGLKLQDDSDIKKSDEFIASSGSSVNSALRNKFDSKFDSEQFENEDVAAATESAKEKVHAKEFGEESLFGDRSETLFGNDLLFEFSDFGRKPINDHHDNPSVHDALGGSVEDVVPSGAHDVDVPDVGGVLLRGRLGHILQSRRRATRH